MMVIYIVRSRFAQLRQSFGESYWVPNLGVYLDPEDVYEALRQAPTGCVVETWAVGPTRCIKEERGDAFMARLDLEERGLR